MFYLIWARNHSVPVLYGPDTLEKCREKLTEFQGEDAGWSSNDECNSQWHIVQAKPF